MKLSKIKTIRQAEEVAENWYQRTQKLLAAASLSNDWCRRGRCYILAFRMQKRVLRLNMLILSARNNAMSERMPKFEKGGVKLAGSNEHEFGEKIIPRNAKFSLNGH